MPGTVLISTGGTQTVQVVLTLQVLAVCREHGHAGGSLSQRGVASVPAELWMEGRERKEGQPELSLQRWRECARQRGEEALPESGDSVNGAGAWEEGSMSVLSGN